jgi:hypothetical protein
MAFSARPMVVLRVICLSMVLDSRGKRATIILYFFFTTLPVVRFMCSFITIAHIFYFCPFFLPAPAGSFPLPQQQAGTNDGHINYTKRVPAKGCTKTPIITISSSKLIYSSMATMRLRAIISNQPIITAVHFTSRTPIVQRREKVLVFSLYLARMSLQLTPLSYLRLFSRLIPILNLWLIR